MARSITFQDVSWFLDLHEKKQLNLDPPYQRRSVWSPKDRRYFIDTILNDYPAPPVFLHKTIDENGKSTYHVVDGKQRLLTIIQFTQNKVTIPDDFGTPALQGKRWKDLERATREKFWNYIIIVEMLPDASEASIRSTFERINRNSKKLSPQEMRHAKYEGWFASTAETEAENPEWRDFGIATTGRSKRMLDVQFISELMMLILKGEISGFDQNEIDDVYAAFDDLIDNPDFSEDEFYARFSAIKAYIKECLAHEPELRAYTRIQTHLYTLWHYVQTRDVPIPSQSFALRYKRFMTDVAGFIEDPGTPELGSMSQAYWDAVIEYSNYARGANTEAVQRVNRHAALVDAIHEAGVADHENQ